MNAREYPVWAKIYKGNPGKPDYRDQELVSVTRETLRLAHSALQQQNGQDYYHNYGAAQDEIANALQCAVPQKL